MLKPFFTILYLLSVTILNAQTDTTITDTLDNVRQENLYWQQLPKDLPPYRDSVEISLNDVPKEIQNALRDEPQYLGWEHAKVFYDKNTTIYRVYIPSPAEQSIRIYGLSKAGEPVTFNEVSTKQER
jgi:hypothetical protein